MMAWALVPISLASRSTDSARTSWTRTVPPARARVRAVAEPMPPPAPVMQNDAAVEIDHVLSPGYVVGV